MGTMKNHGKDTRNGSVGLGCTIVTPEELRDWMENHEPPDEFAEKFKDGMTPEGRVIHHAMNRIGPSGTIRPDDLFSIWKELYEREPTEENKRELVEYTKFLFSLVETVRGK